MKTLKVLTYNILHGFYTYYDPNTRFVFQIERFEAARELIKRENPDILVLIEACFGVKNKTGIFVDYKKIFSDFPYYFYAQSEPKENQWNEWGTALLSKYPILSIQNLTKLLKPFLRTKINFNETNLNLDIVHPHPTLSNEEKEKFFKEIIETREESETKNYILTGDLNSLSNQDNYNKKRLIRGYETFDKTPKETVEKMLKDKTINYLLSKKLIDSYKKIHKNTKFEYTIPSNFLTKNKDSSMRIDYLFCSKDIRIKDAGIISNDLAQKGSDHLPIYAILEIKK